MGKYDTRLLETAGQQHFVIARDQLLDIGSERQLKYRLEQGALERVLPCTFRIAGSPPTWRQDVMAASFASGKTSVASFRTAAALAYLPGGEEVVEISSPRDRRVRIDGIVGHESYHLTELDVMHIDNIPVTRPARTINDLGLLVERGEMPMRVLDHALHDAIRRDLVDVRRVWKEWERLGGTIRPGGRAIETLLKNFTPPERPVDSSPEIRLLQCIRAARLPEPIPQLRVWLSPTWWVDLDFSWAWLMIFIEFDSYKFHGNRDKYMRDAARRLELQDHGWDFVTVTDDELDAGCPTAMRVARRKIETAMAARMRH